MKNGARSDHAATRPPIAGPLMPPSRNPPVYNPLARPLRSPGTLRSSSVCALTLNMADPSPPTPRRAMSWPNDPEKPARTLLAATIAMPAAIVLRSPKRSTSLPEGSAPMIRIKAKALITLAAAAVLTPNCLAKAGMPGATIPYPSATVKETELRMATSGGSSRNSPARGLDTTGILPGQLLDSSGVRPGNCDAGGARALTAGAGLATDRGVGVCCDTGIVLGVSRNAFVGREAELSHLLSMLDSAAAGRPVVTLISGDAGVGKTRLVTELAARAREKEFTVLSGRCAELGDAVPYLPLADALRDASTGPSAGGPLLDALAARPVLSRLLPDRNESQPAGGDMPGLVQQQLFGAVLGLLTELAAASPVLLVLEDVHWADQSTRDLLTFLSRMLHAERLPVVATYRSDDMP